VAIDFNSFLSKSFPNAKNIAIDAGGSTITMRGARTRENANKSMGGRDCITYLNMTG
jgi:membrane carboxypeptidase/penicillin-binding protein PbpC